MSESLQSGFGAEYILFFLACRNIDPATPLGVRSDRLLSAADDGRITVPECSA